MATKPTISDVAARAGVSKAAVSFALNGRPGVSQDTRDRILRVAEDLGFTPNSTARALSFRRSGNLGLVMARSHDTLGSDPFFPAFIAGVESAVAASGIFLLVRLVTDERAESEAYRELARTGRVDGVFVTDLRVDDPRPALLDDARPACGDAEPSRGTHDRHRRLRRRRTGGSRGGPSSRRVGSSRHRAHRRSQHLPACRTPSASLGGRPARVRAARGSDGRGGLQRGRWRGCHPGDARDATATHRDPLRERPDGGRRDRRRPATWGAGAGPAVGGRLRRQPDLPPT